MATGTIQRQSRTPDCIGGTGTVTGDRGTGLAAGIEKTLASTWRNLNRPVQMTNSGQFAIGSCGRLMTVDTCGRAGAPHMLFMAIGTGNATAKADIVRLAINADEISWTGRAMTADTVNDCRPRCPTDGNASPTIAVSVAVGEIAGSRIFARLGSGVIYQFIGMEAGIAYYSISTDCLRMAFGAAVIYTVYRLIIYVLCMLAGFDITGCYGSIPAVTPGAFQRERSSPD